MFFPKPPSRCWVVFALESLKGNLSFFGVLFCLEGVGLGWVGSFLAWLGLDRFSLWPGLDRFWLGWVGSFLVGLGWIVFGWAGLDRFWPDRGLAKTNLKNFLRQRRA
jgi:hypothetical protein